MTELPQWAVEEADALAAVAMETLLSMSDKTVEDRGIWLAGIIARALAEAAKPKWRTDMENAPRDGSSFVAGGWVENMYGEAWWEEHVIWLDDETGDIAAECECPFNLDDFDHWMPLPDAPEVG